MLYANYNSDKILATPDASGACPSCGESLRPKCGQITAWHWAHVNDSGCSAEHEPETDWHREWKSFFPKESVEVPIGEHRADVLTPSGIVVEFQHSGISSEQIASREEEYGRMIWVLDARQLSLDGRILVRRNPKTGYLDIDITRWRTTVKCFNRPVFLDIESWPGMLHVRDFSQRKPTKAERWREEQQLSWGYGGSASEFIDALMSLNKLPHWMTSTKLPSRKRF